MEFVTFHVALPAEEAVHPTQVPEHMEYLSMVKMMFASALLFHPDAQRTVLTDEATVFDGLSRPTDRLVRSAMNTRKLMLERSQAQLRHVQSSSFDRPMVILDSDILLNASLTPIFEFPFDVALTWRDSPTMPINGGFLILNNARPEASRRFFQRFIDVYRDRYMDQAAWFGDQLALRDCLGPGPLKLIDRTIVEVDGCRLLLLPCDTYNFSPNNLYSQICTPLAEKVVLHFKGERKRLMKPFWRSWLAPRSARTPWAHYIGWRERRRSRVQAQLEPGALSGPAEGQE